MAERLDGAAAKAWYRRKKRSPSLWPLESEQGELVVDPHDEHHKWRILSRDWLTN